MMEPWKRNVFVNAIQYEMKRKDKTASELIEEYTKLTGREKTEILRELEKIRE